MPKKEPLTFHRHIPAFLQQMQNAQAGGHEYDRPNPQLSANRRHGKPRSRSEEADDAPLVLDDEGNVVEGASVDVHGEVVRLQADAEEGERGGKGMGMDGGGGGNAKGGDEVQDGGKDEGKKKATIIGNTRKRKVGRVIGQEGRGDDGGDDDDHNINIKDDPLAKAIKAQGRSTGLGRKDSADKPSSGKTKDGGGKKDSDDMTGRKKKKAKKIKLSFDDDEE